MNTPTLNYWPLVIAIEDCYVPETAPILIEVAKEYESEVRGLVFHFAAMKAREELTCN